MSNDSNIEWTEATWNPVTGCTRASAGCDNCYAVAMTKRLAAMGQAKYQGLVGKGHFNGVVRCDESALSMPLHWRKPRRIFVNSMSDLFHKDVPFEFIARVWAVMRSCPRHTFQVLTKRPERAAEFLNQCSNGGGLGWITHNGTEPSSYGGTGIIIGTDDNWPLPNVWLGTSVEDQPTADERIPHLRRCPAAVRFLSVEPMIGPMDLPFSYGCRGCNHPGNIIMVMNKNGRCSRCDGSGNEPQDIHWVIVGGESGPRARPCNIEWIRSIIAQCKGAGVPCFVKQVGSKPENPKVWGPPLRCPKCGNVEWDIQHYDVMGADGDELFCNACHEAVIPSESLYDRKGGDISEWPEDLRVREFPMEARHAQP